METILRVTIGIDVGQSGAIAVLHDGNPVRFYDMPTMARTNGKGNEVNSVELASMLRGCMHGAPGAAITAVVERVSAMPGQGVTSMFNFGKSAGIIEGILATLGYRTLFAHPMTWKKMFSLVGKDKDVARSLALQQYPHLSSCLSRKKDGGRADALWIARWGYRSEI